MRQQQLRTIKKMAAVWKTVVYQTAALFYEHLRLGLSQFKYFEEGLLGHLDLTKLPHLFLSFFLLFQ